MLMPGRGYNSAEYRYGFNGQEKDDEVKGSGNSLNFKFRVYDSRLGKFLSVDPLSRTYPSWAPYTFAMDRPIQGSDLEGLEFYPRNTSMYYMSYNGEEVTTADDVTYSIINLSVVAMHIPDVIYDENTEDFKFTKGGIVGPYGHDVELKGVNLLPAGRYYNSGPGWPWQQGDPDPSSSTQGLHTTPNLRVPSTPGRAEMVLGKNDAATSRLSGRLAAGQEIKSWVDLYNNMDVWQASIAEQVNRKRFYQASVFTQNTLARAIHVSPYGLGQSIQDVTNFVMDGTIAYQGPGTTGHNFDLTTYYREIVYTGIDIMRQNNIPVSQETLDLQNSIEQDYQNNCTE